MAMFRAKRQYLRIRRHTADPDVHVPYLRALLSFRTLERLTEAVGCLCELLEKQDWCHTSLLRILWEVVLKPGVEIPVPLQKQLLTSLSVRVVRLDENGLRPRDFSGPSTTTKHGNDLGVASLCMNFATAIFSTHSFSHTSHREILRWAIATVRDVFSPTLPITARWSNLVLLALFHAPELLTGQAGAQSLRLFNHTDTTIATWRVVCLLSVVEKAFRSQGPTSELIKSTQNLVWTLWCTWTTAAADKPLPIIVTSVLVASFLRVSAILGDVQLKDACRSYCVSSGLWESECARHLKAGYASASVLCGIHRWDELAETLGPPLSRDTTDEVVSRIVPLAPELAYEGFIFAKRNSFQISTDTTHSLALRLASLGYIDRAIPFFSDQRFSYSQNEQLLGVILRTIGSLRIRYLNEDLIVILSHVFRALYGDADQKPHERFRVRIQHILSVMVSSGSPSEAMAIVKDIHSTSPDYFRVSFFGRFIHALLQQRQFRVASRLLDLLVRTKAHYLRAFGPTLVVGLAAGGASALARRANLQLINNNIPPSRRQALAHKVKFRLKTPARTLALKIMPVLRRSPPEPDAIRFAMHVLVRAGHLLAAKNLFYGIQSSLNQTWRTSMGNILLHGILLRASRRNGRQIRKLLATLDFFVEKYGFVCDRVTVNILIKAITRWRNVMDRDKLRGLFDHMIRSGYPAGHYEGTVPFETPFVSPQELRLPTLPAFISFKRHVRPLYKSFIRAFKRSGDIEAAKVVISILRESGRINSNSRRSGRKRDLGGDV
jgi:hypothetical protein